jgi:hypothetical protein
MRPLGLRYAPCGSSAASSTDKPVAAICHAPWTLIEADVVRGRTKTSWPSLQTDLGNAGATWVDEEVVVDNGLVQPQPRRPQGVLRQDGRGDRRGQAPVLTRCGAGRRGSTDGGPTRADPW